MHTRGALTESDEDWLLLDTLEESPFVNNNLMPRITALILPVGDTLSI